MNFDLVIRGGTVVTAERSQDCNIGIRDGKIAALGANLTAARVIGADGRLVLPGGVDSHCHIEQLSGMNVMSADDFYTGTVSAAHGGTTTVIPFCAQHRGDSLAQQLADYHQRARSKAVIDYGFHLIIANPDEQTLERDLPAAIAGGVRSEGSGTCMTVKPKTSVWSISSTARLYPAIGLSSAKCLTAKTPRTMWPSPAG